MSNISNLLSDAGSSYKNQINETRGLVNKWDKTGLLEGMDQDYDKSGMAVLLENQARQLIDEASSTGTATNSEEWSGVALPLVRRIFAEIAAKDFVSVQPMNLPSGLVFYLDFKYGTTTADEGRFSGDMFGNTSASTDPNGGLYGDGRWAYSIKDNSVYTTLTTVTTASWKEIGFNSALSSSIAGGGDSDGNNTFKISFPLSILTNSDNAGVKGWTMTSSNFSAANNISMYNYVSDTIQTAGSNNPIFGSDLSGAASASIFVLGEGVVGPSASPEPVTVNYGKQPTDISRGDFEDTSGTGTDISIPEVNVQMHSEPIVAKTRKLKAVWSPEFAQDLNAYHSIDAEAELTSMLSEYISMEIDLEILDMLIQNAVTTEYWSATPGETLNAAGTGFDAGNSAEAYNQGTWFQTIGTKVQKVSNKIHARTLRGGANFLVTSPDVATIIESIPGYAADTDGGAMGTQGFAMGVQKVGSLNSRFTVYKNPYMQRNVILMGFRGTQFLETGAVYAPYIPLIMTPLVYDPTNFTPRKGVMTRYAKKIVRPEFYGKINIKGLNRI
tara:strand:- start:16074 stop:17741 length:1668 start_codon:yes stop_codon:yes gene_type:complete